MDSKKFTIPHGNVWKRPDEAYFDYKVQAEGISADEIEWNGRYKRIRELRDLAIFGLALYDLYGTPFFVQMNDLSDSPDAFVMRESPIEELTGDIGPVELTFYGRNRLEIPKQSLADRLSEPGGKFTKLPEGYCLVVHIGIGLPVDHEGNLSDSLDIVIYDRFYSPFVFNENGVLYIPAESVYAVIECKQELTKEHIEYSAKKAASVRRLKRTSLPIKQLNGELAVKKDSGIVAGVVTTKSAWTPALGEPFEAALKEYADISRLDFGCSLNDGSFRANYKEDGGIDIVKSEADNSLISFFINLVTKLQQMGNAPAIDLRKYFG